jgi:hypothetical protein
MLRNKNRNWTEAEDRRLLELHAAGRSALSMAAALKRSCRAISLRLPVARNRQWLLEQKTHLKDIDDPERATEGSTLGRSPSPERSIH